FLTALVGGRHGAAGHQIPGELEGGGHLSVPAERARVCARDGGQGGFIARGRLGSKPFFSLSRGAAPGARVINPS
ncbi:MAG: hypothetical protein ACYCYH_10605, partial [Steroidobacteraceae bacterium]